MSDSFPIYMLVSSEIQELLTDNRISLADLLRQQGIQVGPDLGADPASRTGSATKDPVTILLASTGLLVALTPALRHALSILGNRPILVKEMICVPIEDSAGNVVRDASGTPLLQWVERSLIDRSLPVNQTGNSLKVEGPLGIKITYSDKAMDDK